MLNTVSSVNDVRDFFKHLKNAGLNFHPDTDFRDYVNLETGEPTYTEKEVGQLNHLLKLGFDVCKQEEVDIYELAFEIFFADYNKSITPEQ